jgi:hypothetical protein
VSKTRYETVLIDCGFIHIPRTGGSSIHKALCNYEYIGKEPGHRALYEELKDFSDPEEAYKENFWFAFIRNPWDRLVSSYEYLQQRPDLQDGKNFIELIKPYKTFKDFVMNLNSNHIFESMVSIVASSENDIEVKGQPVKKEDFANVCKANDNEFGIVNTNIFQHFTMQILFLEGKMGVKYPDGKIEITDLFPDAIYRFENIAEDFNKLCQRLDLDCEPLEHTNQSDRKPYQEYYDDESKTVVEKMYARDIKLGNYKFDQ